MFWFEILQTKQISIERKFIVADKEMKLLNFVFRNIQKICDFKIRINDFDFKICNRVTEVENSFES